MAVAKTFKPARPSHPHLPTKTIVPWSPSRGSWLLVKKKDELTEEDKEWLKNNIEQYDERILKKVIYDSTLPVNSKSNNQ